MKRDCCGTYTDQRHRSWCREPLKPARQEDVERARRSEGCGWPLFKGMRHPSAPSPWTYSAGSDFQCAPIGVVVAHAPAGTAIVAVGTPPAYVSDLRIDRGCGGPSTWTATVKGNGPPPEHGSAVEIIPWRGDKLPTETP